MADSSKKKRRFWNREVRSYVVLIGLLLGVHFLESRGYLNESQMAFGLDWMLQREAPKEQFDVSIVNITDEDYQKYFCAESPLDARAVVALVEAVRDQLNPAVIGVDLDTSDWGNTIPMTCTHLNGLHLFAGEPSRIGNKVDPVWLRGELTKLAPALAKTTSSAPISSGHPSDKSPTIVWAQIPGDPEPREVPETAWSRIVTWWKLIWNGEREERTALPLRQVVGKEIPENIETTKNIETLGIPRFPVDSDGVVRKYRPRYWVVQHLPDGHSSTYQMSSLPHALAKACKTCLRHKNWQVEDEERSDDSIILKFIGDPYAFRSVQAKHLLQPIEASAATRAGEKTPPAAVMRQLEGNERPLAAIDLPNARKLRTSQIVIIGGTYKGARDTYRTPMGDMPGVRLLAQGVETDLHEGIQESSDLLKIPAEVVFAILFIRLWKFLSKRIPLWIVFLLSPLGVLLVSVFISRILFQHGIWLDSIAIFAGVVVHQTTEELHVIEEKEDEIKEKKSEIETKSQTIQQLRDFIANLPNAPVPDAPSTPPPTEEKHGS